jgi:hypothetical protein
MKKYILALLLFIVSFSSTASPPKVGEFASKIAQISSCVDFSVTSWIRSPKRNKAVGGAENSLHKTGMAVDIVLDNRKDMHLFVLKASSLGLKVRVEGDHIHVSMD